MTNLREYLVERLNEPLINESIKQWPNITTLGNGTYEGPLWGSCFIYEGKKYFCSMGLLNIFPINCRITVNGTECKVDPIDKMQRKELMELYN